MRLFLAVVTVSYQPYGGVPYKRTHTRAVRADSPDEARRKVDATFTFEDPYMDGMHVLALDLAELEEIP